MRWIKIGLKILGGLVALLLIVFLGIVVYVNANEAAILKVIAQQLHENINGTLSMGRMKPTFIRGFPGISIEVKDVVLRDSLWNRHHHTLLEAREIFISVNALSILTGSPRVRDITIQNGSIHVYTDSTGYSNTSVFGKRKDSTDKKTTLPRINHLYLKDVRFIIEHKAKFKYYDFGIKKVAAVWDNMPGGWEAKVLVDMKVKSMSFNTEKGSFLHNKLIKAKLKLSYDNNTKTLLIPAQSLMVGKNEVQVLGKFAFEETPGRFELFIKVDNIQYKDAISLLTPSISSKINKYDFKNPVNVQAVLHGRTKYRDTPNVVVKWQVKENTFYTPGGPIENCSFNALATNEKIEGAGYKTDNTMVTLNNVAGKWHELVFGADTVSISNMEAPVLEGRFTSKFEITKLNPLIGNTFHFDKGNVNVNILYKGGINEDDTTTPYIYGTMQVADASLTYLPRNLSFTNSSITLRFMGSDLFADNVKLQRGTTTLALQGSVLNFLNLYYTAPEKIVLDWRLKSALVNLNEFIPFLAARKAQKGEGAPDGKTTYKISARLDEFLEASSVHMRVSIDKVIYRQFTGTQLSGAINMTSTAIDLKDLNIKHADGRVKMNAHVAQAGKINNYKLAASIEQVNVTKLFAAFGNFGQGTITDKNVSGKFSAGIDVTGAIRDDGTTVPYSINGTTSFKLTDGTLVNFEPFRKIGRLIFRKRNLDSISFRDLDNKFNIMGDRIMVYPMFIESSAMNMHVAGFYGIGKTGTDLKLDIPLRNPDKDDLIVNDELRKQRNMKGIVLHLKAVDGDDGKVKIKWNNKKN